MPENIGLFPLELVLLPTEQIPLHIFEERYKELIGECLREGRPFGMILHTASGLAPVGTKTLVTEVLEQFPDGRLNVVVEGQERFRLAELTDGRSFVTADVEPLEDEGDAASGEQVAQTLELFRRLVALTGSDIDEPPLGTPEFAFALASRVAFDVARKQELLELTSPEARLALLAELLEGATAAVEREQEIARRAGTNGHFSH